MTIGPMWAVPMDIAPDHSGTASGIMNTGSALAAIISPVVGGWLIDQTGNWQLPFLGSMVLMLVGMAWPLPCGPATAAGQPARLNACHRMSFSGAHDAVQQALLPAIYPR